jgi:hypothetical protein
VSYRDTAMLGLVQGGDGGDCLCGSDVVVGVTPEVALGHGKVGIRDVCEPPWRETSGKG